MAENFNICPPVPNSPMVNSLFAVPIWTNFFNAVSRLLRKSPYVYTGTAAPTIVASKIGDLFVDTLAKKIYCATGITSAADWVILN